MIDPKPNKFNYKTANELIEAAESYQIQLPWSEQFTCLFTPWSFGDIEVPNRFVVHPMEGFDGKRNGGPGDLSYRRYARFAAGGSGLIWVEATSVLETGRSNPHQFFIAKKNLDGFSRLADVIQSQSQLPGETSDACKTVIQLTHSGRYSKPDGIPKPMMATNKDGTETADDKKNLLSDDDLKWIRDAHVDAARLAVRAGFDSVDVKACHGYLLHELLFARTREDSLYGGPNLDNRLRLMREIIEGIRQTEPQLVLSARINVFDALPNSFGVDNEDPTQPDYREVEQLVRQFDELGIELWSFTAGIPYRNPWIGRPFDKPATKGQNAPEHPLTGVDRMISLAHDMRSFTKKPTVGAGLSWLRQFLPYVAAGIIDMKMASAIGIGRLGIAYPELPTDLYKQGYIDKKKVCVACSGCTNRMRSGQPAGCIIRDREVYA